MNFFSDNALFVEAILVVLLLAALVVIYIQSRNLKDLKHNKNKKGSSSGSVSKEKHKEIVESRNQFRDAYKKYKSAYEKASEDYQTIQRKKIDLDERYGKLYIDYNNLKDELNNLKDEENKLIQANCDLARENAELNKLVGNEPAPVVEVETPKVDSNQSKTDEQPKDDVSTTEAKGEETQKSSVNNEQVAEQNVVVTIVEPEPKDSKPEPQPQTGKEVIMYASFPRSAGSSVYFSDLTENLADDSYFEIKISNTSGKATFKPLDFMKIRNFDVAWNAMISEGVKPSAATTVCGIEPGKAHKEGNDLIVDNPAKIKLA